MWMKTKPRPEEGRQKLGTHLRNLRALQGGGLGSHWNKVGTCVACGWTQPYWGPSYRDEVGYVLREENMPGAVVSRAGGDH